MVTNKHNKLYLNQQGSALLVVMLVLVLAGMTAVISWLEGSSVQIERTKANATILANAKLALIGQSIGVPSSASAVRPGLLIRPDVASEATPDYDGTAESGCLDLSKVNGLPLLASHINIRCLGRLPWRDLGLSIRGASEQDPTGVMPWYAVSANLVDVACLGVLNSNTLNLIHNPLSLNCTGTALPYPWLVVRDGRGNIVSDRVAAVILIPNEARNGQSRTLLPLAMAGQYLDTLVVPVGCQAPCIPGTYSNADMDNDYIFSDEGSPSAQASHFNDQLVYITIDELMVAVEKRVAQEVVSNLKNYYIESSVTPANRFYPYAADLGDSKSACVDTKLSGLISLSPAMAICTSSTSCVLNFPNISEVEFTLSTPSYLYTSHSGACNHVGNTCECTGVGACVKSTTPNSSFTCNLTGVCTSTGATTSGTFEFTYIPKTPDVTVITGLCSGGVGSVTCSGNGGFSSFPTNCTHPRPGLSKLPAWFTQNRWQYFISYQVANDCSFAAAGCDNAPPRGLRVGVSDSVNALVVSVGQQLPTQSRPSNLITDYLDSVENTNADNVYDAVGTLRSSTYNDQMFIVAP